MAVISQEILTIKVSTAIDTGGTPVYADPADIQANIANSIATAFGQSMLVEVEAIANLQIEGNSFPVVSVAGTGAIATLTFPTQGSAPYVTGQSITIQNVTPTGYNGTYTVLTCGTSNVTIKNSTTGSTSFVANVGTITEVA